MSLTAPPSPDVSVVIATRNRPTMLRRALKAVFEQDANVSVEAIVVFDQTDPQEQLPSEFPGDHLKVLRNNRTAGLAGARNTGTLASSATWLAYCDDDDVWFPDKLSKQLDLAHRHPTSDFFVGGLLIDHEGHLTQRPHARPYITHDDLLRSRVAAAHPSTFLFRREEFISRVGLMDEELFGGHATDYDLLLRYAEHDNIWAVQESVVRITMHMVSYFGSNWAMKVPAIDRMLEKHDFSKIPEGHARIRGRRAFALAASGRRTETMRECAAVLRLNWQDRRAYLALAVSFGLIRPERLLQMASRRGKGI
jgi:glycosyltransferase involved in cell wall biosynthesis